MSDISRYTKLDNNSYVTCIKLLIKVYRSAGFIVGIFLMDGESECISEALLLLMPPVELNVTSEL